MYCNDEDTAGCITESALETLRGRMGWRRGEPRAGVIIDEVVSAGMGAAGRRAAAAASAGGFEEMPRSLLLLLLPGRGLGTQLKRWAPASPVEGVDGKEGPGVESRLAAMPLLLFLSSAIAVSGRKKEEAVREVRVEVEGWRCWRAGL